MTAVFGAEPNPGIDDDPRVVILIYGFDDVHLSGYFEPADLVPALDEAHSNRREMIYLDSSSVANEPQQAGALAAHEFAHLVVYYRDYVLDPSPGRTPEPSWLAEGLSAYAEHVAGYDDRVGSQLRSFASDPDTNLTSWVDTWGHYGVGYAFVSYLAAREGQSFIGALVDYPADGVAGINDVLWKRWAVFDTFATLFDEWVIANFLDGRPPNIVPYSYPDVDVASGSLAIDGPLPTLGYQLVSNFGAVYLDFPATAPESVFSVTIDGEGSPPLRAALISWDSAGVLSPDVQFLTVNGGDGTIAVSAGRDRHTLAVWARGAEGEDAVYGFDYAAAADPPGGIQFLDLAPGDPYYAPVTELLGRHVISGKEIPPGSGLWYFKGTENLTRAQFAKIIMEATELHTLAIDHQDDPSFSDVVLAYKDGLPQPYPYDYIEEAASLGIVRGYADGTFRPSISITRGQLVLMITRGAREAGKPLPVYSGGQQIFADVPPSSPLYPDIMAAYAAGIMTGSRGADGRLYFRPTSTATRYHVAKMTANLLHFLDGSEP